MKNLETIEFDAWEAQVPAALGKKVLEALESGKVIYFPQLSFELHAQEHALLSPDKTDPKSKNISFDVRSQKLGGAQCSEQEKAQLAEMIKRYAILSKTLLNNLASAIYGNLEQARTSLRPVEIEGRKSSYRKDDTLLHVDAFPSSPTKGRRILRFFTNINQDGKSRVWRIGEPFPDVVQKMGPRTAAPLPGIRKIYQLLGITKDYRTLYDHYMLQIHDNMKGDSKYQQNAPQEEVRFPPGSSWMVFTDQVSHAAMSGQHVLEQTYHVPPCAMQNPETTPLAVLERYYKKKLVINGSGHRGPLP